MNKTTLARDARRVLADHLRAPAPRAGDLDTGAAGREVGHDRRRDALRVR